MGDLYVYFITTFGVSLQENLIGYMVMERLTMKPMTMVRGEMKLGVGELRLNLVSDNLFQPGLNCGL